MLARKPEPVIDALSTIHSGLKSAIGALKPGLHSTDVRAALAAASDILAPSQLPNRRIVVVTDLTQGGLEDGLPASVADALIVHSVRETSLQHVSIQEARYQQEGSSREPEWRIEAKLKNWGSEDLKSQKIHLEVDET